MKSAVGWTSAGFLLAMASPLLAQAATLDEWLKERAEEYRAYLRGSSPANEDLFRHRSSTDPELLRFAPPASLAPLIRAVSPGVVNISAVGEGARSPLHRSLGSGFILGPNGYVVTNQHVVDGATEILVKLSDGRALSAEVVGKDRSTDVALLRIQGDRQNLPFVYVGDSDRLEVGDWALAIGNPFGLDRSVSLGIISAKERTLGIGAFDDFIQTDALINPGNSGGPLFNMRGEVIGVNTAILTQGQGIGFAVPINLVKELLPNLLENGHIARGWIGINIEEFPSAAGAHRGAVALVKEVYPQSPAANAGIQSGDRIISVNGREIESYAKLVRRITFLGPGTEVELEILRAGVPHEYVVKLIEKPDAEPVDRGNDKALGLAVKDFAPDGGSGQGVVVTAVVPGSAANRAGIVAGDIITEVNRARVTDVKSYQASLGNATDSGGTLFRIQRGDSAQYVALKPN